MPARRDDEQWKPLDLAPIKKRVFWVSLLCITVVLFTDVFVDTLRNRTWTPEVIWNTSELVLFVVLAVWVWRRDWSVLPSFLMVTATELNVLFTAGSQSDLNVLLDMVFILGLGMIHAFLLGMGGLHFTVSTGILTLFLIHRPGVGAFHDYRFVILAFIVGFTTILSVFTRTLHRFARRSELQWRALMENRDAIESRERLNLVNQLVIGLAHNINTPLGNSRLRLSVIQESLKGSTKDVAAEMDADLDRISAVVKELRGLLILESEDELRILGTDDLTGLLHDALRTQGKEGLCDDIKITGMSIITRPLYFLQLLLILIENADLYGRNPEGELELSINLLRLEDRFEVTVGDSGSGITGGDEDGIFQPYFRMGTTGHGRGMGLSIARQICLYRLKGRISYGPNTNQFEIFLPLEG